MESLTQSLIVSANIKDKIHHSWQYVASEFIANGIYYKNHGRVEFDRRAAYLMFDVGVETVFKTFLLLDKEVSGVTKGYQWKKEIVDKGNYREIVRTVREVAPTRLSDDDKETALHYHGIRNQLYHQGNGIIVSERELEGYSDFAVKILRTFLDVDLNELLREPEHELQRKIMRQQEYDSIVAKKQELDEKVKQIYTMLKEIIISMAPKLMNERTWHKFYEVFSKPNTPLPESFFHNTPKEYDAPVQVEPEEPFDKFLARHINDEEVRSYFLGLSVDERRRIASGLVYWIDEELYGEIDPFSLSVQLLSCWPEFPYDPEDVVTPFALASMYPDDMEGREYDSNGRDIVGVLLPSTDEALSEGNFRLEQLEAIYQALIDWREERELQDWE